MITRIIILAIIVLIGFSQTSFAEELLIDGFQRPDGAITLFHEGDFVDTYFATKSLLIAKSEGMEVNKYIDSWINWAIKQQAQDGLFGRYKLNVNGGWDKVSESDADDAALALWLELLYTSSKSKNIPKAWKNSINNAQAQLDFLFDDELGIYHVSKSTKVGLLMDNSEIYSAFVNIAESFKNRGLTSKYVLYMDKANNLRDAMIDIFSYGNGEGFRISTQIENGNKFYPDKAAQLFPAMYSLVDDQQSAEIYKQWMKINSEEWIAQKNKDYPWGLFAVFSANMNDISRASCWRNSAEPMRYSNHWNILEEVSLQIVKMRIEAVVNEENKIPCTGGYHYDDKKHNEV